jgi:GTPase Era involved in 16S rRNA processing
MANVEPGERAALNEYQRRHLLVSCQHIDKLLTDIEEIGQVPSGGSLFPRHVATLTPLQRKLVQDYVSAVRSRLLTVLDGERIPIPPAYGQDNFAIRTALTFVDIAVEELRPKYMRGYGAIPEALVPRIEGIVDELRTIVRKFSEYLAEDPGRDLQARLSRLERAGDEVRALQALERIVTSRGLVEFRPRLAMLVDRASSHAFEVAVFGRVSSGKSSLLNHVLGIDVLPVGVTPVTAVPTRIAHGAAPALHVSFADRPDATLPIERLPEFVTEAQNPGNLRHVVRLVVELPAPRLESGVVFVDTPGLGSLARAGAEQTMAYLPRCDLGVVLLDAGATLSSDDLLTIHSLYMAAIPASVVLSKADLLGPDDRHQAARYITEQLRREVGVEVSVRAVSVKAGFTDLLDRWFAEEIEPLSARQQDAARVSLRRKVAALREAVQKALGAQADRVSATADLDTGVLEAAEGELRDAAGLLTSAERRCDHLAGQIAGLGPEVLRQTARRVRRDVPSPDDAQAVADAFAASIGDVVGSAVDEVRLQVSDLAASCARALERSAAALRRATDGFSPATDELPALALTPPPVDLPRARLLAFSARLQVAYVEHRFRRRLGARLDEALAGHAMLVASWARRSIETLRAAFAEQAEPLRAAFADARRPARDRPEGDAAASILRDLEELDELGARPEGAAGRAPAALRSE